MPARNKTRRAQALKKAKEKPLREKAFEHAVQDVGQKEHPAGSNRCPISNDWPMVGPWCAVAVSTWYLRAGSKAFRKGIDWAYCPYLLDTAVKGTRGLAIVAVRNVQRGDIVLFDWDSGGVSDHVGLFDRWVVKGKTFKTIEGNTCPVR